MLAMKNITKELKKEKIKARYKIMITANEEFKLETEGKVTSKNLVEIAKALEEYEYDFTIVNQLRYELLNFTSYGLFNKVYYNELLRYAQSLWEEHIENDYTDSLSDMIDEVKSADKDVVLMTYLVVEDNEYTLEYNEDSSTYMFLDANGQETLDIEFSNKLIKILKGL